MKKTEPTNASLLSDQTTELYKSILKSLPLTTFLCDRNKKIVDLFNPTSFSLADYHIEQYIGLNMVDLLRLPDFPLYGILLKFNNAFDKVLQTTEAEEFEYEFNGEYFGAGGALLGQEYVIFHIRNITALVKERMKAESIIRNELSMAMKAGGITSWAFDVEKRTFSTGPDNEVIGKGMAYGEFLSQINPEHRHKLSELFDKLINGEMDRGEMTVLVKDISGEQVWLNLHAIPQEYSADGKVAVIVGLQKNVTQEKTINDELRRSKHKTELAMKAADIMLWEFDVRTQLFTCENEPLNDYDNSHPLSSRDYAASRHPEDQDQVNKVFDRMCKGEDWSFKFDSRIKIPGFDDWLYCTIDGSPYERDTNGKVTKYIGTRKNITELQKKKQLQGNILNSIPVSIHIKDVDDNFRYVFCNEESKRLFGTDEEKTTYDVLDADKVARIEKTDKEVFATGRPYFGLEHIELKDGRCYDTLVRKSIIYDDNKRLLLNVRWDQSLQNDLERRAKVLNISMEAMNAYTWFYELDKDKISFGEGADKIGHDSSQYDTLAKFIHWIYPDDKQRFWNSIQSLIHHETDHWNVEYRADLNQDGIYEWWQTRGMMETTVRDDIPYTYIFGMTLNIDEHKQTELTLLKNREDLNHLVLQNEMVLNNTNSGLAYITTNYIVQWENISVCSASLSHEVYKKGELCYRSAHGRNIPCEDCVMRRAFQSQQMEQTKFTFDNGNIVEIFATPVFREDLTMDGIVIRVDDVTERERMIKELQSAKALAEQSDKLKSAFLANMSHEIRTPLNAIVGFSGLLADTISAEEKEEYLKIININNELLLKLISDILDLSKIEAGTVELKYEEFDFSGYFDDMAASMKQRINRPDVCLVANNPYPGCMVKLDKNRIAQIMTNYVTNAIKYTPAGIIEMGYELTDEGIRVYVKDSGIGIQDEKKDKVFHRFEKLDEFAQGTGLGLSICKAIAESMGGNVGFESQYGKGSHFWAVLPCRPELKNVKTRGDKKVQRKEIDRVVTTRTTVLAEADRKVILVAEDISSNFLLVSALLRKYFDLVNARNGSEAVEAVRNRHFDLVLMDMKMPVMDGLTATAEIRKFNTDLPIIALTAHAFDTDQQAALEAGCNEYLVKPIDKAKLIDVLKRYCCRRR